MLVTLDGSELSEIVLPYVKWLVGRLGLDVALLHVCKPEESELTLLHRAYIERKVEVISGQAEEARKKAETGSEKKEVEVRGELASGYPAEEILRYADENSIDLILMATHGRSGLKRWAIGSVADKVLHASKVPVWLVPARCPEDVTYDMWPKRTILVPLDGSELAEAVLPHVEALAEQNGVEPVDVVLLRVSESPVMSDHYFSNIPETREEIEKYLARVEKRLQKVGLSVQSRVLTGEPAEQIVDYASASPFSLVVMSTHARSGLSRWVLGSVAMKVVSGVCSPILLVRPL
jgi:nucleotide-binding universal stress UspA family protein